MWKSGLKSPNHPPFHDFTKLSKKLVDYDMACHGTRHCICHCKPGPFPWHAMPSTMYCRPPLLCQDCRLLGHISAAHSSCGGTYGRWGEPSPTGREGLGPHGGALGPSITAVDGADLLLRKSRWRVESVQQDLIIPHSYDMARD